MDRCESCSKPATRIGAKGVPSCNWCYVVAKSAGMGDRIAALEAENNRLLVASDNYASESERWESAYREAVKLNALRAIADSARAHVDGEADGWDRLRDALAALDGASE